MSRTWAELLGDEPTAEDEPERTGFFTRMRDSLSKSRRALTEALAEEVEAIFGVAPTLDVAAGPSVVLVVGVNGTGKTTTIGKLAQKLHEHERSVLVGAADTFRAAAEEQLEIWARRAEADFVGSPRGADAAAVAYDAVEATRARGLDVA